MRILVILVFLLTQPSDLFSQSVVRPSWSVDQELLNILDIRKDDFSLHSSVRPQSYRFIHDELFTIYQDGQLSKSELNLLEKTLYQERKELDLETGLRSEYQYIDSSRTFYEYDQEKKDVELLADNKRTLFKNFLKNPAHLYEYESDDFSFDINPIIHVAAFGGDDDGLLFENQRGISVRATIDNRVYLQTALYDNQARYANYIQRFIEDRNAVPQAGFYKNFNSVIVDTPDSYDFLLARGHLGFFVSEHVSLEIGHDRHRIGDGLRSLLLSDFSPEYFYFKFGFEVWKLKYQSIIAELTEQFDRRGPDERLGRKYMATHYLDIQLNKNWKLGLFESVVYNRSDQLELQYLNPVIFYRAIEGAIGSPDNVLLGLNTSYTIKNRVKIYGQAIVDEFKIDEILERNGWWANKLGFQFGFHYLDALGISDFHWQSEFNTVRPYTYTHRDISSNYTHYNQPLAHPLGANFREWINRFTYSFNARLSAESWISFSQTGDDPEGENLGGDIFIPSINVSSERPFGNTTAQGVRSNTWTASMRLSYEFWQNAYIDLNGFYRNQNSQDAVRSLSTSYLGLGVRLNFNRQPLIL